VSQEVLARQESHIRSYFFSLNHPAVDYRLGERLQDLTHFNYRFHLISYRIAHRYSLIKSFTLDVSYMSRALNSSVLVNVANVRQRLLVFVWLFLFTTINCVQWGLSINRTSMPHSAPIDDALISNRAPSPRTQARRGFRLEVHSSKHSHAGESLLHSETESLIKGITSELNETISLPTDVGLSLEDCGDSDVYYDNESRKVVMCNEWIAEMERIVSRRLRQRVNVRQTMEALVAAVVLHESAHALISLLKLPVTGREEDDADQFSTLLLLHQQDGVRKALAVARIYKAMAQVPRGEPTAYWDEHSLDAQRYYDALCMIYGRDSKGNAKLVSGKALPDERAGLCKEDYLRIESSWKTLLKPYANDSLWAQQ
jgi:hypothetical protein